MIPSIVRVNHFSIRFLPEIISLRHGMTCLSQVKIINSPFPPLSNKLIMGRVATRADIWHDLECVQVVIVARVIALPVVHTREVAKVCGYSFDRVVVGKILFALPFFLPSFLSRRID